MNIPWNVPVPLLLLLCVYVFVCIYVHTHTARFLRFSTAAAPDSAGRAGAGRSELREFDTGP